MTHADGVAAVVAEDEPPEPLSAVEEPPDPLSDDDAPALPPDLDDPLLRKSVTYQPDPFN